MHFHSQPGWGDSARRFNWRGQAFSVFADRFGEQFAESFSARGRGRGGGRQRILDSADLRLVLLHLIAEQPRHGYELIKAIETLSGGAYAPSPGMVYPSLSLMADVGEVVEKAEGNRKLYLITEAGAAALAAEAEAVTAAIKRLQALAEVSAKASARTDSAPVRRAMRNLHMALQTRLSEDDTNKALHLDIAAILDEAAAKIERL